MITFKQFLAEVDVVHGAKNLTGPGSDTQSGANKAKDAKSSPSEKPRVFNQPKRNTPNKEKPSSLIKDKQNAVRFENKLKSLRIPYKKTIEKDGTRFEYDTDLIKKNAERGTKNSIDASKEEVQEQRRTIDTVKEPGLYAVSLKDKSIYEGPVFDKEDFSKEVTSNISVKYEIVQINELGNKPEKFL